MSPAQLGPADAAVAAYAYLILLVTDAMLLVEDLRESLLANVSLLWLNSSMFCRRRLSWLCSALLDGTLRLLCCFGSELPSYVEYIGGCLAMCKLL